jgi:integration host factor subunit beta
MTIELCKVSFCHSAALQTGKGVEFRGFGSFSLNYQPPRTGRNPNTGEKVAVPSKHVPHFKAGKELRERVELHPGAVGLQ